MTRLATILGLILFAVLALPAVALAIDSVPPPQPTLALPTVQLWAVVIGALVPIATYILNHFAPWASEPVKALVLVAVSAAAGALYQLLDTGDLALDVRTLEVVGTAVVAALLAHHGLYKPATISTRLGGGTNRSP